MNARRGYGWRLLPRPSVSLSPASVCTPPVTGISLSPKATCLTFVLEIILLRMHPYAVVLFACLSQHMSPLMTPESRATINTNSFLYSPFLALSSSLSPCLPPSFHSSPSSEQSIAAVTLFKCVLCTGVCQSCAGHWGFAGKHGLGPALGGFQWGAQRGNSHSTCPKGATEEKATVRWAPRGKAAPVYAQH